MKICPFCEEELENEVMKCNFCGEDVSKNRVDNKTRICKGCGVEKPETLEFFSIVNNKRPDGTRYALFRGKCKKCMVKNVRSWQKDNPEMKSKTDKERSERLKNAPGSHTKEDISVIRISQNNKCYYCADILDETQEKDHKISLIRGGTNNPDNIVLACRSCNRDKHNKTVEEFFQWRTENKLSINNDFYTINTGLIANISITN